MHCACFSSPTWGTLALEGILFYFHVVAPFFRARDLGCCCFSSLFVVLNVRTNFGCAPSGLDLTSTRGLHDA